MRALGLAIGAATLFAAQAAAADAKFEKSLLMLDPSERLEQLCDYTAMAQIRNDDKSYRPDRAVANAMGEAQVNHDTIDKLTEGEFINTNHNVAGGRGSASNFYKRAN